MQNYQDFLAEILVDETSLQARLKELGAEISADYADSNGSLLLICILRGGVPFLVDLMRHITIPHMLDFMAISSYGKGARESTGNVRLTMDLLTNTGDKHALITEDFIDGGNPRACF